MKRKEFREVERSHVMESFECQVKEPVCDSITDEKPEKSFKWVRYSYEISPLLQIGE